MVSLAPVSLLATGGTIACTKDANGALVPTVTGTQLCQAAGIDLHSVTVSDPLKLDSSEMSLNDLDRLLTLIHRSNAHWRDTGDTGMSPVVITHGTDSMEETAMAIDRLIGGPIVLTGAQRPSDDDAPDGPTNLRKAVETAPQNRQPVIVMGGLVVPAYGARKVHTTADAAFQAPTPPPPRPETLIPAGTPPPPLDGLRVDLITASQGADSSLVDAAVEAGTDGLVIAAFGSGNAGRMAPGIRRALDRGVPVVICSRVPTGPVAAVYGGGGGGATLTALGARTGGELSPAQARMELLCHLAVARRDSR